MRPINRVGELPTQNGFYYAVERQSGDIVLMLEATSEQSAVRRLLYLLRTLHTDCWVQLELKQGTGQVQGVPAYLDAFFPADIEAIQDI